MEPRRHHARIRARDRQRLGGANRERRRFGPERLEERVLLDAGNIFAEFRGSLSAAGATQQIPIALSSSDFTIAG